MSTVSSSFLTTLRGPRVDRGAVVAAFAEVRRAGVSEDTLRPLVDAFVAARDRGVVDDAARLCFEAGLPGLVGELPRPPASVGVRLDEAKLESGLARVQGVIAGQTARIGVLEQEVATLEASVGAKHAQATSLLAEQQALQAGLAAAKQAEADALVRNMVIAALLRGTGAASASSALVTVGGVQAVLSIDQINARLATIAREITTTRAEVAALEARMTSSRAVLAEQRRALGGLQVMEQALRQSATASLSSSSSSSLAGRLQAQVRSLEAHQALSRNLGEQIAVLEAMKSGIAADDAHLTALIASLTGENAALETAIAASRRQTQSLLIDAVLDVTGLARQIDLGGLAVSTKTLLLDGIAGLRLELLAQATAAAEAAITGALGTTPQTPKGQLFLAALRADHPGAVAVARGVAHDETARLLAELGFDGPGARVILAALQGDRHGIYAQALAGVVDVERLTAPQRLVLERLLFGAGPRRSPSEVLRLAEAITKEDGLDDARARVIVAGLEQHRPLVLADDPMLRAAADPPTPPPGDHGPGDPIAALRRHFGWAG